MVKIRVKAGKLGIPANTYRGYLFLKDQWLEIRDKGDIEWFKSRPDLFEIKGLKESVKEKIGIKEKPKEGYTKEELEKMSFSELKEIGRKLRVTGRSKEGLIEDIIGRQEGTKEPEI